ncbi:hypothetical protein QOZ80_3AG0223890 [Eleusine coracana subsp. coracana]|nr:hypothetical protein QOZ80_3AG0223890 [Eleusine coracana subsp. coracana]
MGPDDTVFALKIAAMVIVAVLIVAIVAARSGACARRAVVHDVERALGAATLMPYAQAAVKMEGKAEAEEEEARQCCAICLSDYAGGNELVRVVPACGHFFHADCDIDRWLRAHRTFS